MKTIIIIPSRLSATRLPGKPLLKINGLSIISHVVRKAKDAKIGDLDGNGVPELVIVMNLMKFADNNTPHVFIATYDWDGTHFSELPSTSLDIGKDNRSLRCNNFQLLDQRRQNYNLIAYLIKKLSL